MTIAAAQSFIDAAKKRRSVYTIKDTDAPLTASEIESIVTQALESSPSPWNISSSRAVILFGANHKKLFNEIVYPTMETSLPAEAFAYFGQRIKGFAGGVGSVLFFEDQDALEKLKKDQPMAAGMAGEWSDVSSGMVQFVVWTALSVAGFGCSLQHFNFHPGIVAAVRKDFDVPESWTLKSQLVFGSKTAEPGERAFAPSASIGERLKVIA